MINLSDLISKQVLNLYTGRIEGTIKDVCFDDKYKKIVSFTLFDSDEEEYTCPANKIYAINDYVVLKNGDGLTATINQVTCLDNNPIGRKIFSIVGQDLGTLLDIALEDNLTAKEYVSSSSTFSPTQIVSVTNAIIVNLSDKKVSASNFRPKVKLHPIEERVKIMSTDLAPQKFIGNSDFLLGRTTTRDIYSLDDHILAPKGATITPKLLSTLKSHGKLSELTLYSKK